jgi:hypothetical protein
LTDFLQLNKITGAAYYLVDALNRMNENFSSQKVKIILRQYPELYSLVSDLSPVSISGNEGPKQPRCEWMYRKEPELNKSRHVSWDGMEAIVVAKK